MLKFMAPIPNLGGDSIFHPPPRSPRLRHTPFNDKPHRWVFLMTASMNVNWEGSSTDIERHKLITIAVAVNRQFGTTLDCFYIKLTWAKLWAQWET